MNSEVEEIWKKFQTEDVKKIIYKGTLLFDSYLSAADAIENFEVYDDDIWLCGFPKTGTTWSREMIWTIANDLNFDAAKATLLDERFPQIEFSAMNEFKKAQLNKNNPINPLIFEYLENTVEYTKNVPKPRFIKTHLPFNLLPRQLRTKEKKAKIIYVWRNPKDACISHYHFVKWMKDFTGDFTEFCKLFLNDAVVYMPYWNHVIEFWNKRNEENILILKYENMKADLRSELIKIAKFLGKKLDDEHIPKLLEHLSLSSMRSNASLNFENVVKSYNFDAKGKFIRKGEADQWKTEMSSEMIDQFDKWICDHLKNNESLLREIL